MERPQRILVVDDDAGIVKLISTILASQGYAVITARNGLTALTQVEREMPEAILLDIMMPEMDGLTLCKKLRERSSVPIIMLTAMGQEEQVVRAFDAGADDYLTKPFRTQELLARIRAVIRRAGRYRASASDASRPSQQRFTGGALTVEYASQQVQVAETTVHLTPTEFQLLTTFIKHQGELITHADLLRLVWGPEYQDSSHLLHIYVNRLRTKLAAENGPEIINRPGVGYIFKIAD